MTESVTIPNSYQTPNVVVDRLYQYLLPDEIVVLTYAIRHILGWRDKISDRRGRISLSMFESGFTTKDGTHYGGCGLTRPKVSRALAALVKFGVLAKAGKATQEGQEWALTFDDAAAVQWSALTLRAETVRTKAVKRVAKATKASANKRRLSEGSTTVVPPADSPDPAPERYDSRTTGGTTAVHKQTQSNTHKEQQPLPAIEHGSESKPVVVVGSEDSQDWLDKTAARNGKQPTAPPNDPDFGALVRAYESDIGMITPTTRDLLIEDFEEYPHEWLHDAIKIAVLQNNRRWAYVRGILKRWAVEGKNAPKPGAAPEGPPLNPPDPDCPLCDGQGVYSYDVPYGDPRFGKTEVCACRKPSTQEAAA